MPLPSRATYGSAVGLELPIDVYRGFSFTLQSQLEKANAELVPRAQHPGLTELRKEAMRRLSTIRCATRLRADDVDFYKECAKDYFLCVWNAAQSAPPEPAPPSPSPPSPAPAPSPARVPGNASPHFLAHGPAFAWWPVSPAPVTPVMGWGFVPTTAWAWTPSQAWTPV
ncbi:hypothetical protein PUNSTDRAFT_131640 [Punctularia strigosozonata HHB-11173 SS5]|uniref:uncharacterized protein n=1 Tax=Punctularia strigosozonata (strain HHB-11173) TaxID=741275 RepID=UPI000441855F|nr:uncharacterized protein PUNSTDRAFT_131640 [Punctularia strigosozonata HHB-11173 SS5]EIN11473.1 hypothetical protein PUNSTDRAFT_131640 [Punctularia strigosozonata HHB-11173 SS5]